MTYCTLAKEKLSKIKKKGGNTYPCNLPLIGHSGPRRNDRTGSRRLLARTCIRRLRDRRARRSWHPRRSRIPGNLQSRSHNLRCRRNSHDRWTKVRRDTDRSSDRIGQNCYRRESSCTLKYKQIVRFIMYRQISNCHSRKKYLWEIFKCKFL